MELMSALLLYASVATAFQQGLGIKTRPHSDIKLNTSLIINPRFGIAPKKLLLNINGPPLMTTETELQSTFRDPSCRFCTDCMKMALKARANKTQVRVRQPNDLYYEVLQEHFQKIHRHRKRSTDSTDRTDTTIKTTPETNSKVMITKYASENGRIYALKVNDTTLESDPETACRIYIVTKSLSCKYSESKLVTIARTTSKKSKKNKPKSKNKGSQTVPTAPISTTPAAGTQPRTMQKRRTLHIVESSNIPDNFMPSIEEMY